MGKCGRSSVVLVGLVAALAVAVATATATPTAVKPQATVGVCDGTKYFNVAVTARLPAGTSEAVGNETERRYRPAGSGSLKIAGKGYRLVSQGAGYVSTRFDRQSKKTLATDISWQFQNVTGTKADFRRAKGKQAKLVYQTKAGVLKLRTAKPVYFGQCAG